MTKQTTTRKVKTRGSRPRKRRVDAVAVKRELIRFSVQGLKRARKSSGSRSQIQVSSYMSSLEKCPPTCPHLKELSSPPCPPLKSVFLHVLP
ncbi:hypothetical protein AVEN_209744-1 [Araneus ventricosus]|uniref:Uncharacterized protein n=1 Tax=Araneus ventricosus TaxID=182803 RepID=A0A4Y2CCT6_ARAVE|nr:hypothetical protein AVEN_209744-1 [Araneus ventricosus]